MATTSTASIPLPRTNPVRVSLEQASYLQTWLLLQRKQITPPLQMHFNDLYGKACFFKKKQTNTIHRM
jgi:hypothetical protein